MKISLVNNLFAPVLQGGTEVVVETTIDLLRQRGHEVSLITTQPEREPRGWNLDSNHRFPIYRFRPRNLYYYTEGTGQPVWKKMLWHAIDLANAFDEAMLTQILEKEKPDLVHGHNLKGMSYTLPRVCRKLGLPYIHTIHNYQLLHPYGTFWYNQTAPLWHPAWVAQAYQALHRRLLHSVKMVISPTRLPLDLHKQAGFFGQAQTHILPSPVVITGEPKKYLPSRVPKFVYLGALEKIKGIHILVEAALKLAPGSFILDIYGEGSLEGELRQLTSRGQGINWLGHLSQKEALGDYDALIYPSQCYETQGLSMAEALQCGTPVIASRIGSIPEMIHDGHNGWLFRCDDAKELERLLQQAIQDPGRLRALRENTQQSVERYRPHHYIEALEKIYRDAIIAQ